MNKETFVKWEKYLASKIDWSVIPREDKYQLDRFHFWASGIVEQFPDCVPEKFQVVAEKLNQIERSAPLPERFWPERRFFDETDSEDEF